MAESPDESRENDADHSDRAEAMETILADLDAGMSQVAHQQMIDERIRDAAPIDRRDEPKQKRPRRYIRGHRVACRK